MGQPRRPAKSSGAVVSIYVAPVAEAPMVRVNQVRAVPGKGLEGDRYFSQVGTYSNKPGPDREITLIEIEALEATKRDYRVKLDSGSSRRNIVTRGVPLNHLVGCDFRIGKVRLHGIRLCEPCSHLEQLTLPGVSRALVHRGGLRARILTPGLIRVGDVVESAARGRRLRAIDPSTGRSAIIEACLS